MRQLSTDRPDKTESAYTLDAGHFQLEMDLVSYTRDHDTSGGGDTRTDLLAVAPVNLKIGLLNNLDFQVVLESYNHVRVNDHAAGTVQTMSGFGDVTTRLKLNFWGNDGGATAFAAIPLVKFPSNQDNLGTAQSRVRSCFRWLFNCRAAGTLAPMAGVAFLRDENNEGYHASFLNSITFGRELFGKLDGYAEFFSEVSTEQGSRWIGTVDFGLTYELTPNIQLDAGIMSA
jgi:hypothetical protein